MYYCQSKLLEGMIKHRLTLWGLCALMLLSVRSWAQDPHFTQYYANPLYLNPAFAGSERCPRFNLNYRNQYPVLNVYQTYSASYDQYVGALNGGLGILAVRDEAGDGALSTTEVSGVYSYHLKVSRNFTMQAGFQATLRQRAIDWNGLMFPDMIDPFRGFVYETAETAPANTNNTHLDISAGLLGYTEKFYIGFVANHLTEPDESFFANSRLPLKLTGHAGFTIPLGRKRVHGELQNYLIPNVVYQIQGPYDQLTVSTAFNRGDISGGLGMRTSTQNPDAVVVLLGYDPREVPFRIGYSYDITISTLANNLGGAHEISLSYRFPCSVKKKQLKAIKCPKF